MASLAARDQEYDLLFKHILENVLTKMKAIPKPITIITDGDCSVAFAILKYARMLGVNAGGSCMPSVPEHLREEYNLEAVELSPQTADDDAIMLEKGFPSVKFVDDCIRSMLNFLECEAMIVFKPNHNKRLNHVINHAINDDFKKQHRRPDRGCDYYIRRGRGSKPIFVICKPSETSRKGLISFLQQNKLRVFFILCDRCKEAQKAFFPFIRPIMRQFCKGPSAAQ